MFKPVSTTRKALAGRTCSTFLRDSSDPESYGLPKDPKIPWTVALWKGPLKWLGNLVLVGGILGTFFHYLRYGPRTYEDSAPGAEIQPIEPDPDDVKV